MEYQVPQFIEVEDKIIGPLTLKQFIYVAGTAGLCILFFFSLSFMFAFILSIPVAGFGAALAFYKVNGKSFVDMLEAAFNYYTHEKLLLWKQDVQTPAQKSASATAAAEAEAASIATQESKKSARLTRGKLSELAWSLDVKKPDTLTARTGS